MARPGLFDVLVERDTAPPRCSLEEEYGTALLLDQERVAVNFVSTIDGVVSFGKEADNSRAVGGGVTADRTLMAMLRSVAGVIVVGAGTLRATLNHQWTAQALVPGRADELAALRAAAGRPVEPAPLLVVGGGGGIPADADAIARPAVPVHALSPDQPVGAAAILAEARRVGHGGPVLCEGGPHLFGTLLAGVEPVDLFLTLAPQLAGGSGGTGTRRHLVEGVDLTPFARAGELRSVRRAGQHLLLRYAIGYHKRD